MSCEPPYDCPGATGSGNWCDIPCCNCCPPCPCHTSATFTYAAGSLRLDQPPSCDCATLNATGYTLKITLTGPYGLNDSTDPILYSLTSVNRTNGCNFTKNGDIDTTINYGFESEISCGSFIAILSLVSVGINTCNCSTLEGCKIVLLSWEEDNCDGGIANIELISPDESTTGQEEDLGCVCVPDENTPFAIKKRVKMDAVDSFYTNEYSIATEAKIPTYPKEINHRQNKPLIHFSTCVEGGCSGWIASNGKCIKTESSVAGDLVYSDVTSCLCNSYQDVYACKEMAKKNLYPSLSSEFPKFNYDLSKDFKLNVDDNTYKDDEGNTVSVLTHYCSVPCEEVVVTLVFTGCCMANLEILGSPTAEWTAGRPVFAREVHFIAIGDGTVTVGKDKEGPCKTICNGWVFSISINGGTSHHTFPAAVVNCDSVVVSWIPPFKEECCIHCLVDYSFTSLPACENGVSVAGIHRKNKKTISKKKLIKKVKDQTNKNQFKKKRNL